MKWLCWFKHKWKKVKAGSVEMEMHSLLFKQEWTERVAVVLEECQRCENKRAFMISASEKRTIDPLYAEHVVMGE